MESGIYTITCVPTGRFYVGSAKNFTSRWKAHRKELRGGRHHSVVLQRAWDMYGEGAFEFRKVMVCGTNMLIEYEQRALDAWNPDFNMCKTAGSRLGVRHDDAAKAKISASSRRLWSERRDMMTKNTQAMHAALAKCHKDPEFLARHSRAVRDAKRAGAKTLTYKGDTKPIREWAEQFDIPDTTLRARHAAGWDIERALTTPVADVTSPEFFAWRREKCGHPTYLYRGERLGLTDLATALGTTKGALRRYITKYGVDAAISYYEKTLAGERPPTLRNVVCEYAGKPQSMLTLSSHFGAPYVTFRRRVIKHGLDATIKHYETRA